MATAKTGRGAHHPLNAGDRFGRWTVIERTSSGRLRESRYLCRCACGTESPVQTRLLRNGTSQSCGCLNREMVTAAATKHGQCRDVGKSPAYESWRNMLIRVRATKGRMFKYYGARGISVCERWKSFENFLADMGPRPDGTTLDRRNNDKNYDPDNCHWATWSQQVKNRRPFRRKSNKEIRP